MAVKRFSIRKKLRLFVLSISIAALLLTAAVGFFSMMKIRGTSRDALVSLTQQNLTQQARTKADVADVQFSAYANYVQFLSDYIHALYVDGEHAVRTGSIVPPPLMSTGEGVYSMQRCLAREDIALSSVRDEMRLLSHLQQVFTPFMQENGAVISTCYASTASGLMVSYDAWATIAARDDDGEVFYDYFDTDWFTSAKLARKAFFTGVYTDGFGRGLNITCAAPFFDAADNFAGAVCMDILITDLYDKLVLFDVGEGSAAFLIDASGTLISPDSDTVLITDAQVPVSRLLHSAENALIKGDAAFYAHARIASTGWQLCFYVPEQLVFAPVRPVQSIMLLSITVFILVFLFVIVAVFIMTSLFSVMLTNPVTHLRRDVDMISSGVITHRADVVGNDEISDLSQGINQMADALQTYTDIITEKERLDTELEVAMRIQANMLPSVDREFPHGHKAFELAASMTPAKEIGGDFYDFFLIDSDHLALVMADVAGKGVPAALLMVTAKTLIKSQTLAGGSPAEIFTRVNRLLCIDNAADLFVTAWLGILEISTGTLVASNAGHENPALKRAGMRYSLVQTQHNPPLGSIPDITFTEHAVTLSSGDRLFLYTDGLVEAKNADKGEFGTERLLSLLNKHLLTRPDALVKIVKVATSDFSSDIAQYDDITMLSLYYEAPGARSV